MNDFFLTCLALFYLALNFGTWGIVMIWPGDHYDAWMAVYWPLYILTSFVFSVSWAIERNWFMAGLYAVFTATGAWFWWHDDSNRRRRKKLLGKVAERVAELGGRLVIVRPVSK